MPQLMPLPWIISFVVVMVLALMMKIIYSGSSVGVSVSGGSCVNFYSKWCW